MRRQRRFILGLLLATLVVSPQRVWSADELSSFQSRVVTHRLTNGITLLIYETHFSPTVAIRMMFPTGSVDEVSGKTGLAHMFEHMMFKGTRTLGTRDFAKESALWRSLDLLYRELDAEKARGARADQTKIASLLDRIHDLTAKANALVIENELWSLYEREGGSSLNAGTSRDYTQYRVDLPANKLELWAMLDSARVREPVFRQFYQEREVVKEERRMRVDNDPDGRLFEQFLATAYLAHPYRQPTIGWEADLDRLHVADLEAFYARFYTPDRLTIAVVGDVRSAEVIGMVERYFGPWSAPKGVPSFITDEPVQTGERRLTVRADSEPKLVIGFPLAAYPSRDHFVAEALVYLLTSGTTSRLYKSLVEKRELATSIEAFKDYPGNRYAPRLILSAVPRYPVTNESLLKAITEELSKLAKKPIEPWELEKVRALTEMQLLGLLQTNGGMADALVYAQAIYGDWRYLSEYRRQVATVTAEEVQALAARTFTKDQRTVAFLEPAR